MGNAGDNAGGRGAAARLAAGGGDVAGGAVDGGDGPGNRGIGAGGRWAVDTVAEPCCWNRSRGVGMARRAGAGSGGERA